jgi:hypothetical protein
MVANATRKLMFVDDSANPKMEVIKSEIANAGLNLSVAATLIRQLPEDFTPHGLSRGGKFKVGDVVTAFAAMLLTLKLISHNTCVNIWIMHGR